MTSVTQREYSALLAERPPRVLRSRAEYDAALEEIDHLMVRGEQRTEAESEYYELLATLVADYDRNHVDPLPKLAPLAFLKEVMRLRGITPAQIGHLLGRAAASYILNGDRGISKVQAKKLAELFQVDAGAFI